MASSATTGTASPESSVTVACLYCHRIFSARKIYKGPKGRFRVSSGGLSLHLRTNCCEGLCRQHYKQRGHSTTDYCSSIVVVESPAPVIQPSIPSSLNHPETFAVQDTDADHDDSALSFGDNDSVSPEDLRNSKPL